MEKEIIATIHLAPGRVGFYDPLSRIHLTLSHPETYVYSGTNCASLRRNVKSGVIRILEGTLGEDVPPLKVVKVNGKYHLASNAEEEMKPVVKKADAPVKEDTKKKDEEQKKAIQDKAMEEAKKAVEADKTDKAVEANKDDKADKKDSAKTEDKTAANTPAKKMAAASKKNNK